MALRKYRKKRSFKKKSVSGWKKLAGIANRGVDLLTNVPGPIGTIAKTVKGIKNLINVEAKYVDNIYNVGIPQATGFNLPVTYVATGSSDITRNGNSVLAKSVDLKVCFTLDDSVSKDLIRFTVVLDKQQPRGVAIANADIFTNATAGEVPESLLNKNNSDRFVILADEHVNLSNSGDKIKYFSRHLSLSQLHCLYIGNTNTLASAGENMIYIFVNSTTSTLNNTNMKLFARFNFMDN